MPASLASSDVRGFSMPYSFAHDEQTIKQKVRTFRNDLHFYVSHNTNMANRRGIPKFGATWYIKEWMDYYKIKQARMIEKTGWSKASTSQIYNGIQDYSPKILHEAAIALNLSDFELLMHPDQAMAYRQFKANAEQIVHIVHEIDIAQTPEKADAEASLKKVS